MNCNSIFKLIFLITSITSIIANAQDVDDYFKDIEDHGVEPISFVQQKLKTHDLILFDDALHSAYEPFQFYQDFLTHPETDLDIIFIEVLGIDAQDDVNAYLNSPSMDKNLLLKVFQNDFSGFGLRYEIYLDLLSAVWKFNHSQSEEASKIKVICLDQPIYWRSIHNRKDYDVFLKTLISRDYFLYLKILEEMNEFKSGQKGIFLSNTRHVYKEIRNSTGEVYWNCGTFFYKWHLGKSYSIRFHNVALIFELRKKQAKSLTAEGLDNVKYYWAPFDNGLWEEAFERNQNTAVAIPLKNTYFGKTNYVGNHMLNSEAGLTMYDAYDAVIFLAPIHQLHFSAQMNFFYTKEFKIELKRRIGIIYENNLDEFLKRNEASSLDDYIDEITRYQPRKVNNLLGNKDE